jgi:hypothetical protein
MRYRGNQREQAVARILRELGYLVASLRHVGGPADLLALPGQPEDQLAGFNIYWEPDIPLLVEVKGTTDYPWASSWGPSRRAEMIEAGVKWNVEPVLAWWPPNHGPIWLPVEDWPA